MSRRGADAGGEQEQMGSSSRSRRGLSWKGRLCMSCMETEPSATNFVHPFLLISMHFYPFQEQEQTRAWTTELEAELYGAV